LSTSHAGDYVDRSASLVTGETVSTVRGHKEAGFTLNQRSGNGLDHALSVYYADMIQSTVEELERALSDTRKLPPFDGPIPVAIGGGSAKVHGFKAEVTRGIRNVKLPLEISEVRLAKDPLNTTARGTLMGALMET
jgi:hypothetical protein